MKKILVSILLALPIAALGADDKDKLNVAFGGYLDVFYAFDFNRPSPPDRTYGNGTQPMTSACRHNEFNVGLAYLDAKIAADRLRGRLALQAGTSVHANYLGESLTTSPMAGELVRHLQEATAGYRLADGLWVDAGIYLAHIGLESFLPKDNWLYTRSFMADFSPYYETGVKLSWQINPEWGVQLHVLNGWQNIYDNNANKAVGTQLTWTPNAKWTVTYNTFFGEETAALWRLFHDFIAKVALTDSLQLAASFDLGFQRKPSSGTSAWYGAAIFLRWQATPKVAATARVERYSDPDRVIVQPANPATAFVANSASIGVDYDLLKNLTWRNELRGYAAEAAVFPTSTGISKTAAVVVTALALSF